MTLQGHRILAVIPARGGSKGIPRKNLQKVGGRSLVARAAAVAKQLSWIDAAVLSTDDPEIADEGREHGLQVPFMRPAELASDSASGLDTWRHAWTASESCYATRFDCSVLLQPTSPLRRPEDVEETLTQMLAGGFRAAATVSRVPGHYTPEKTLLLKEQKLAFLHPDGARHSNRQTIPAYYSRNGLCYAAMRHIVVDLGFTVELDCLGVISHGFVANIDEPIDLEIANYLAERAQASS